MADKKNIQTLRLTASIKPKAGAAAKALSAALGNTGNLMTYGRGTWQVSISVPFQATDPSNAMRVSTALQALKEQLSDIGEVTNSDCVAVGTPADQAVDLDDLEKALGIDGGAAK